MARPDIPWHFGSTDDTWGVVIWVSRIENLRAHFQLIKDHMPEDADWLRGQVTCALEECDRYIANYSPTLPFDASEADIKGEA
jgi:hypothetical protein